MQGFRQWLAVGIGLLLCACATAPPEPPRQAAAARCLELYDAVDRAVARHGTTPSAATRIDGFPYLRVNRFLAGFGEQPLNQAQRRAWLARLAALDRQARQVELITLPRAVLDDLAARPEAGGALPEGLASCSQTLQASDLAHPERLARLSRQARVPDDYRTVQRAIGLYPLTALPVSLGVARWHRETRHTFLMPLESLPVQGERRRFRPPEEVTQTPSLLGLPRDALGIPEPAPEALAALFAAHAPVWEIDIRGAFDRPGAPLWATDGTPSVDPAQATVYRHLSYARWQGEPVLQLNYVIWFAERPRSGPFDILGGALDGLVWRVTLDARGRPLLYDSIHPCGCYHLFFPSTALRLRRSALALPEPPLVPQYAPFIPPGSRLVVRIGSGNHYIQRVYADRPDGSLYAWRDYQQLYAVPAPQGARSLFGPDGLVPGSERAERWLLWPMGIPSPGAMRERGRQATAFVGRRHFDDPELIERLFQPGETPP